MPPLLTTILDRPGCAITRAGEQPRRLLLVALIAVLSLLAGLTATASAATNEEERIAETRAALDAVREELGSARDEAEDDAVALDAADRQLEAAFAAVESARQAVDRQRQAVSDAERRLAAAQVAVTEQRQLLSERVGRLYRQQRPDPLLQFLDASSLNVAVRQTAYMNAIGREDRAVVEGLENAETEVEAQRDTLELEQTILAGAVEEQQALFADIEELRNDRALVAAASEDLVARLQAREEHLESEQAQLVAQIRAQQAAAAAAIAAADPGPPATVSGSGSGADDDDEAGGGDEQVAAAPAPAPAPPSGGGFGWPGGSSVTSPFGQRGGRLHAGIDIGGGTGSAIVASRSGSVIAAGSGACGGGYGICVLIGHSGGFTTLYAHLSSLAVSSGQSVGGGQYLGGMGCTGSCTGTHLHFEIRANGSPVNPLNYL